MFDDTPLPSFGELADHYLKTHGYSMHAILTIAHVLDTTATCMDFVNAILSCVHTSKPQKALHTCTKVHIKWTSKQKAALRAKRAQHHIDYGTALKEAREVVQHQAEMLYKKFGRSHILSLRSEALTAGMPFFLVNLRSTMRGLGKEKVNVIVAEVSAQWKCMNKEEHSDATDNLMQSLGNQCKMKDLALHNVPLNAFQDGRKTLDSIDHESCITNNKAQLSALNACTGMEILLFAVLSDIEHFNQPHIFQTSCASAFFDACLGTSVGNIALHLEGFSIAGVQDMAKTHVEVLEWKKKIGELIHNKLHELNTLSLLVPLPTKIYYRGDSHTHQDIEDHFQVALAKQNGHTTEDMPNIDEQDEDEGVGAGGTGNDRVALSETESNAIVEATSKRGTKWKAAEPINIVTTSLGVVLPVQKRLRAPKKDKGIPCGPRKKKTAQLTAAPSPDASIMSPTATQTPSNPLTTPITPSASPSVTSSAEPSI
ncbi:hypothetical protein BD769DRAFT_1393355 [Suillus cothurnatus]|nr:hypothetical protein BD769DRAFT_1393355 [Suillus cothurnatus]